VASSAPQSRRQAFGSGINDMSLAAVISFDAESTNLNHVGAPRGIPRGSDCNFVRWFMVRIA